MEVSIKNHRAEVSESEMVVGELYWVHCERWNWKGVYCYIGNGLIRRCCNRMELRRISPALQVFELGS